MLNRELHQIGNYEALFRGRHRKSTTVGYCTPSNGWNSVSSETLIKTAPPLFNGWGEQATIPIDNLIHATHLDAAVNIIPEEYGDGYTFTPRTKSGKKYDLEDEGSYVEVRWNSFKKIPPHKCVLPGKLSWWSPDVSSWERSPDDLRRSIWKAAGDLREKHRIFPAPYLSNPPESPYGDHGFVVGFKDLLNFYQESRTDIVDDKDRAVYLRVGGTLKYRFEICHVVLVCTKFDQNLKRIYPSLSDSESDVFDHKGFILDSGEIKNSFFQSDETLDFKPEFIVKCVPKRKYFHYETSAFAFYYPEESDLSLSCTGVKEVYRSHKCTKQCQNKLNDVP